VTYTVAEHISNLLEFLESGIEHCVRCPARSVNLALIAVRTALEGSGALDEYPE